MANKKNQKHVSAWNGGMAVELKAKHLDEKFVPFCAWADTRQNNKNI